ncbi:hypothetical protein ACP3TY_05590 [Pseudomonas rustica]|uniref:hypothetical protein n=1 Tax=Pseudomonas rustica TaxID=2827099 RepID=UPI003CF0968C
MSASKWMLHHFHPLIVHSDCESAPEWYYQLAEERLHLDFEGDSLLALNSIIKFGGLSPIYPLIHGDFIGFDHNAALCFSTGGIYPTIHGDWREESVHQRFAIAVLKTELITAGAREGLHTVTSNDETRRVPDNLFDYDTDTVTEFIESEVGSFAARRTRPAPSENTYRSQKLYWQPTTSEIDYPIKLYNRFWTPFYQLRLPAIRLLGPTEENCYISKLYIIVDNWDSAETIQQLMTGLYHSGMNSFATLFDERRLLDTNIIITDELHATATRSLSIEVIEQLYPTAIVKAVNILTVFDRKIDVAISEAIAEATIEGTSASHNYAMHSNSKWGPSGDAWAETAVITHPVVQHMIQSGIADTLDDHAHIDIPGLPRSQNRYQNEAAYRAACQVLSMRLGLRFKMYSYDD